MKLFVGLGNPGEKYKNTRHNVGFMVIDQLISSLPADCEWEVAQKYDCSVCRSTRWEAMFVKPLTFMNKSGVAVKKLVDYYKIKADKLYIVHDDLDIALGEFKIHEGRGPKEHMGLLSIEGLLGRKDFWRIRVGVENRGQDSQVSGEEYVLQQFSKEELDKTNKVISNVIDDLKTYVFN